MKSAPVGSSRVFPPAQGFFDSGSQFPEKGYYSTDYLVNIDQEILILTPLFPYFLDHVWENR